MEGAAKKSCFILIIIISGILQVTILDYFKIFTVKPDLLLISMVIVSLAFEFRWAFALSIFAGFFKDAFGITSFGINTLLFGLWSFLILKLSKEITIDNNIIRVILVFIVTLIHNTFAGLIFIYSGNHILPGIFLRIVFFGAIYTAVALLLVFRFIESSNNIFFNVDYRKSSAGGAGALDGQKQGR